MYITMLKIREELNRPINAQQLVKTDRKLKVALQSLITVNSLIFLFYFLFKDPI